MTRKQQKELVTCNVCGKELSSYSVEIPIHSEQINIDGEKGSTFISGEWCSLECLIKEMKERGIRIKK